MDCHHYGHHHPRDNGAGWGALDALARLQFRGYRLGIMCLALRCRRLSCMTDATGGQYSLLCVRDGRRVTGAYCMVCGDWLLDHDPGYISQCNVQGSC